MTRDNKKAVDGLKARLAAKAQQLTEEREQYTSLIKKASEKAGAAQAALEAAESGTNPQTYIAAKSALSAAQDEREFFQKKLEQLDKDGILSDQEFHTVVQDVQAAALTERQLMEKDVRALARRMGEIADGYVADIAVLDKILEELAVLKPNQPAAFSNTAGISGVLQFAANAKRWETNLFPSK